VPTSFTLPVTPRNAPVPDRLVDCDANAPVAVLTEPATCAVRVPIAVVKSIGPVKVTVGGVAPVGVNSACVVPRRMPWLRIVASVVKSKLSWPTPVARTGRQIRALLPRAACPGAAGDQRDEHRDRHIQGLALHDQRPFGEVDRTRPTVSGGRPGTVTEDESLAGDVAPRR
jgi:hypothetical protein